jgi:hypothetical protein
VFIALSAILIRPAITLFTPDTIAHLLLLAIALVLANSALVRPAALITSILAVITIGKLQVFAIGTPAPKQVAITAWAGAYTLANSRPDVTAIISFIFLAQAKLCKNQVQGTGFKDS